MTPYVIIFDAFASANCLTGVPSLLCNSNRQGQYRCSPRRQINIQFISVGELYSLALYFSLFLYELVHLYSLGLN